MNKDMFISSLSESLYKSVNRHISFDSEIQVKGHIYLIVDRGETLNYVLDEHLHKTSNNGFSKVDLKSSSFHYIVNYNPGDGPSLTVGDSSKKALAASQTLEQANNVSQKQSACEFCTQSCAVPRSSKSSSCVSSAVKEDQDGLVSSNTTDSLEEKVQIKFEPVKDEPERHLENTPGKLSSSEEHLDCDGVVSTCASKQHDSSPHSGCELFSWKTEACMSHEEDCFPKLSPHDEANDDKLDSTEDMKCLMEQKHNVVVGQSPPQDCDGVHIKDEREEQSSHEVATEAGLSDMDFELDEKSHTPFSCNKSPPQTAPSLATPGLGNIVQKPMKSLGSKHPGLTWADMRHDPLTNTHYMKTGRPYERGDPVVMRQAVQLVKAGRMRLREAARHFSIPFSTLRDFYRKLERAYGLPSHQAVGSPPAHCATEGDDNEGEVEEHPSTFDCDPDPQEDNNTPFYEVYRNRNGKLGIKVDGILFKYQTKNVQSNLYRWSCMKYMCNCTVYTTPSDTDPQFVSMKNEHDHSHPRPRQVIMSAPQYPDKSQPLYRYLGADTETSNQEVPSPSASAIHSTSPSSTSTNSLPSTCINSSTNTVVPPSAPINPVTEPPPPQFEVYMNKRGNIGIRVNGFSFRWERKRARDDLYRWQCNTSDRCLCAVFTTASDTHPTFVGIVNKHNHPHPRVSFYESRPHCNPMSSTATIFDSRTSSLTNPVSSTTSNNNDIESTSVSPDMTLTSTNPDMTLSCRTLLGSVLSVQTRLKNKAKTPANPDMTPKPTNHNTVLPNFLISETSTLTNGDIASKSVNPDMPTTSTNDDMPTTSTNRDMPTTSTNHDMPTTSTNHDIDIASISVNPDITSTPTNPEHKTPGFIFEVYMNRKNKIGIRVDGITFKFIRKNSIGGLYRWACMKSRCNCTVMTTPSDTNPTFVHMNNAHNHSPTQSHSSGANLISRCYVRLLTKPGPVRGWLASGPDEKMPPPPQKMPPLPPLLRPSQT